MMTASWRIKERRAADHRRHQDTLSAWRFLTLVCSETYQQRPVSQAAELKSPDGFMRDVDLAAMDVMAEVELQMLLLG